jgi:Ca2+-dependent lipid-binding protein
MMNWKVFILTTVLFATRLLSAQETGKKVLDTLTLEDFEIITSTFIDGDTIPHRTIEEVIVYPRPKFNNRRQMRRYSRLIINIKKVYPYAKLAREKLLEMDRHIATLSSEREKREYINKMEEELFSEFEEDLKKLTISQGRLLIKLIDRETGDTTYVWLKELKGSVSAFFWQAIARIFGSNLKWEFDAPGEDRLIDEIIHMIDAGML